MLCKETYCLVTGFNGLNHVPACSVLAYEVSLTKLSNLVVSSSLSVDDFLKLIEANGICVSASGFNFFLVVVIFFVKLRDATFTVDWVAVFVVLHLFHVFHIADHATCLTAT